MRRRAGFSIVEVAIVAAVFSVVLAATTSLVGTTGGTLATGISISTLEAKANRLVEAIGNELLQAGVTTLDAEAATGTASLPYRRAVGYANGALNWGPPRLIELRPDEIEDGVDNDSDGLVDEQRVDWIQDPGETSQRVVTWARGVRAYLEGETRHPTGLEPQIQLPPPVCATIDSTNSGDVAARRSLRGRVGLGCVAGGAVACPAETEESHCTSN